MVIKKLRRNKTIITQSQLHLISKNQTVQVKIQPLQYHITLITYVMLDRRKLNIIIIVGFIIVQDRKHRK